MAERVGFEPTEACTSLVFKTRALNHSTTSPCYFDIIRQIRVSVKFKLIFAKIKSAVDTDGGFKIIQAYALPAKRL